MNVYAYVKDTNRFIDVFGLSGEIVYQLIRNNEVVYYGITSRSELERMAEHGKTKTFENMEILNGKPEGNELAEAAAVDFIKYSIKMLDDIDEWMQTAKSPAQPMLAVIDILLFIGEKYPYDINLLLRKNKTEQWKTTFNQWFNKNNKKIPNDIKNDIKINADIIFDKLEKYGH